MGCMLATLRISGGEILSHNGAMNTSTKHGVPREHVYVEGHQE